ncbi:LAMI_0A03048g1_1 [Lachancea mirantina]|uniref:LAMI_0A03048g1_1 n=1 Tax=Lachancea mirantina TaxID=1230905 RepID=A0A1G4IND6_9SACH|nr:LAMI_0A03048g1_1 [Lachancea mirantina]
MEVIAHCKVYPLSTFYRPAQVSINWIARDNFGNVVEGGESGDGNVGVGDVGFVHLIEHDFKISEFKGRMALRLVEQLPSQASILIVDVVASWRKWLDAHAHVRARAHYLTSPSLARFETLIAFLNQLNETPADALRRCTVQQPLDMQLGAIIIDNISYYVHDSATYEILLKTLRRLRQNYGCIVLTTGYGLEFYDGVENSQRQPNQTLDIATRLPMSYVKNMDCVLVRDTATTARVVFSHTER